MRSHGLLFSTLILAATAAFARAQSLSSPGPLLPNAPNPAPAQGLFFRDYLVPHDSRNDVPRINPAAQRPRHALGVVARNNSVCYTVRAYNFPTDGSADMAKPTSSTNCEVPKDGALKRSNGQMPR
jgi:hypothetical protein